MPDTIDHYKHLEQSLQEALDCLHQLIQQPQLVTIPQALESLERNAQSIMPQNP